MRSKTIAIYSEPHTIHKCIMYGKKNSVHVIFKQNTGEGKVISLNYLKAHEGMLAQLHSFLTSVLDGLSGQLHVAAALSREKNPHCPLNKRMGVFRTGLGSVEKREIIGHCRQ